MNYTTILIDKHCLNSLSSVNASIIIDNALQIAKLKSILDKTQYLYPEMVFYCDGIVTKWIFGGIAVHSSHKRRLPELQIWRKININSYIKIASSSVNGSTMIGPNLYEFIPQPQLQFQKGDIFGIYAPNENETPLILYVQSKNGPQNVMFDSNDSLTEIHEINARAHKRMDFPLVTAEIGEYFSTTCTEFIS